MPHEDIKVTFCEDFMENYILIITMFELIPNKFVFIFPPNHLKKTY